MKVELEDDAMVIRPENSADRAYLEKLGAKEQGSALTMTRQDGMKGYGKEEKFHLRIEQRKEER